MPATFALCQAIIGAGGHIANIGVHGKPVELHLDKLWDRNITLTTRLVDTATTPMLIKLVLAGRIEPKKLITHRFALQRRAEGLRDLRQRGDRGRLEGHPHGRLTEARLLRRSAQVDGLVRICASSCWASG